MTNSKNNKNNNNDNNNNTSYIFQITTYDSEISM